MNTVSSIDGKEKIAAQFNSQYRYMYIDYVSIDKPDCGNYLGNMYLVELEIKDATESSTT